MPFAISFKCAMNALVQPKTNLQTHIRSCQFPSVLAFTLISASLVTSQPAQAFNALGHRVVAIVAEHQLTPAAKVEVTRLLELEGKTSLTEVSSWADEIRDLKVPRQPSHSIKLMPVEGADDTEVFCKNGSCVTGAIEADIRALRDIDVNDVAKLAALKYLTHFVGDLHQPLHAAAGERNIILDGRERKLHEIWDATLINSLQMKDFEVADAIGHTDTVPAYAGDSDIEAWAREGRDIVKDQILPEIGGFHPNWKEELLAPPVLPHEYPRSKQQIILNQLGKAGSRLAAILNDIYRD